MARLGERYDDGPNDDLNVVTGVTSFLIRPQRALGLIHYVAEVRFPDDRPPSDRAISV
jgi:hypothetical protein